MVRSEDARARQGLRAANRWWIVLIATGFNLLMEYSMRGINNLKQQPILPLVLFALYFTYFTMLEDIIARFRLRDHHLMLLAFFFGTIYTSFSSGRTFRAPTGASLLLGINWRGLLFVNLVWWGALQAVMTFYIANRLAPRDWEHRLLSRMGWVINLILNGLMILLLQLGGALPQPSWLALIVVVMILMAVALVFWRILPRASARAAIPVFTKSRLMDCLGILTVTVFLACALLLTTDPSRARTVASVNETATQVVIWWTMIVALIMLAYRLLSRRPISV